MPKTVVVSGASRGIGRATARACAAQGDRVVLAARSADELHALAAEIEAAGGAAMAVPCDTTSEAQVSQLMNQAAVLSGQIDVLVCAAGIARVAPFEELTLADWEQTIQVSLTGTFLACKHAAPHMASGGLIVVLSSIAGRTGFPQWSAYSAAKFGLMGFAQAMREELRPRGIRVTVIIPGAVDTPLWADVPGDWSRATMLQPDEVAQAIVAVAGAPAHMQVDEVVLGHVVGML